MSKRKMIPMPEKLVHKLEPLITWPWPWWVDVTLVLGFVGLWVTLALVAIL